MRFFVLIFFIPIQVWAQANVCDPRALESVQSLRSFGCELETMAPDCQQWFKENPETIEFARDCKNPLDQVIPKESLSDVCGKAFGDSWLDSLREFMKSASAGKQFYDACESEELLSCKRDLALKSYALGDLDPSSDKFTNELRETSTLDLLRKYDSVRAMANRDADYRAKLLKAGVPLEGPRSVPLDAFATLANQNLVTLGVKLQCYNRRGYLRLLCYGGASAVQPAALSAAGLIGLKGAKWTNKVLSKEAYVAAKPKVIKPEGLAPGNYDLFGLPEYMKDAVHISVNETGHVTLVAGSKKLDATTAFRKPTVTNVKDAAGLNPGMVAQIRVPPETLARVEKAIVANAKTQSLSCLHGVCKVTNAAGIEIKGVDGRILKAEPFMAGLIEGNVRINGKAIRPDDIRIIQTSEMNAAEIKSQMLKQQKEIKDGYALVYGIRGAGVGGVTGFWYVIYNYVLPSSSPAADPNK